MHASHFDWAVAPNRYSAKRTKKPVNFFCVAPKAQQVTIAGDFNHWNPSSHPMQRQPGGGWTVQLELSHGHHQYLFFVDGQPTLDPRAQGVARDRHGNKVSLISVS